MLISNTYYNYVTGILQLVNSFIINSVYTANVINRQLDLAGESISSSPSHWKYYLNLAGIPYIGTNPNNSDPTDIKIYSLDNEMLIPFTVESLLNNPMTHADLKTLGTAYTNLLVQYPSQELLIRGIIIPIPYEVAIEALDYQILYYNSALIDSNETNLIPKVQTFIYSFTTRWDNGNYSLSDPLYPTALLGILFINLPMTIINIRLENCKTPYVHSWHVWNYLSSYFDLAKHKDIIPYEQALFLYRNIGYIISNCGTAAMLDFLNTGFAQPFNLQLSAFTVRQDIGDALNNLNTDNLQNLTKNITIAKFPYGESVLQPNLITTLEPKDLINLLIPTGIDNYNTETNDINKLITTMDSSAANDILTSIIEGTVKNNVTLDLVSQIQEQIHNWFYLTSINAIRFKISLDLAEVGLTNYLINANDAAVLYLYANAMVTNTSIASIPKVRVRDIMLPPTLSESRIKGLVEPRFISGATFDKYELLTHYQTYTRGITSLKDFDSYIASVVNNKFFHLILISDEYDFIGRSELNNMVWAFYQNIDCTFVNETTYPEFFHRLGLDPSRWTNVTFNEIITQISNNFMGVLIETSTLQSPYSNMLDILTQLCSYTVTFVPGPSTNYTTPLWPSVPSIIAKSFELNLSAILDVSVDVTVVDNTLSVNLTIASIKENEPITCVPNIYHNVNISYSMFCKVTVDIVRSNTIQEDNPTILYNI